MNKEYYVTLTGAKKNIGDFLITYRCERLLNEIRPDRELIKIPNWEPLDKHLDLINNSKGIIIFGGPGYQMNMYPGVYKLVSNLDEIKVPIIPMGLGWKGVPGDNLTLKKYKFNQSSLRLLKKMEENTALSCRDYYTQKALRNNGIKNVKMTGCPVWYDIDSIGKEMTLPKEVNKVVYTPAQSKIFKNQSVEIMKVLKSKFPNAQIYCSFHRGIDKKDEFTHDWEIENTTYLANKAKEIGLIPVDTSFNLDKISFYDECDLHVGYRVHGHIYFLSKRKPSILLHEDGRGRGVSESLNVLGVDGFTRTNIGVIGEKINNKFINKVLNKLGYNIKENKEAVNILSRYIDEEVENNFIRFAGVGSIIDKNFQVMKEFLKELP